MPTDLYTSLAGSMRTHPGTTLFAQKYKRHFTEICFFPVRFKDEAYYLPVLLEA